MVTEEWRAAEGRPGYEVSNQGRVRSLDREVRGPYGTTRRLKGSLRKVRVRDDGYVEVMLVRGRSDKVHILVARAFLGTQPEGTEVCHNDGDRQNNAVSNLRYDTHSNNMLDQHLHRSNPRWEQTHCLRGHELAGGNLRRAGMARGMRACRACANAQLSVKRYPDRTFEAEAARYYKEYMT